MHQQISPLTTDYVNVWELHAPGERHYTSSVETLHRYALALETERVRISSNRDGSEAEFRVDGPEGRLLWHEVGTLLTLPEAMSLNQICQQAYHRGILQIGQG